MFSTERSAEAKAKARCAVLTMLFFKCPEPRYMSCSTDLSALPFQEYISICMLSLTFCLGLKVKVKA